MIKRFQFLVIFLTVSLSAYSQRYISQLFNEVNQQTVTYLSTGQEALQLDIYQPKKDTQKLRPLMLFVHGGGFAGGARDEPEIIDFCKNMARRGMVAVSMSYTLTMKGKSFSCDQTAENKMATFKNVGLEIAEATAFLLQNKEKYNIDPSLMVLAGSSAGAEAVLHTAFWPEAQKPLPTDFKYAGVISMAGAIFDLGLINNASAMPMQLFHGTCDDAVPYGSASHHYCDENEVGHLMLHGAGSISKKLEALNKGYYLVTGCGDNHSWAGKPFKHYNQEIADFIANDVVKAVFRQLHQVIAVNENCDFAEAPYVCVNN